MSVKHLRTAMAALALVTVAAVPAHADPWARDQAAARAHADAALHARSVALNERYGIGIGTTTPLVQDKGGDGVDGSTVAIGAAVALIAVGGAAVAVRRRPAQTA
jgi:hypothetical protein